MKTYQMCARCVMDTTASDISFNADGVCNYCADHLEISSHIVFKNQAEQAQELERLVERVKASGRGKPYDCVIGLSGGVDSSYALYLAVRCGLRPIAVHMDNGWNSELAQQNIENLVSKLKVDFYTHVIDWEEFRALQQAFFDADVVDVELLTDNALAGVNYHQALKYRLKYILAGTNQATEGMRMPPGWNWFKHDKKNIYSIWKRFGDGRRIRTFPGFGVLQSLYVVHLRGVRWISFLDYTQ